MAINEPCCCLCCTAWVITVPINRWNLHWNCSVATMTPWIRPNHYQSTLLNVCSYESLIPHCLTMKILDKNLWAWCSKDNPPQCTNEFPSCNWIPR
jgi:hypothetical protein